MGEQVLLLLVGETRINLIRGVGSLVDEVEQTGEKASNGWAESVGVQVVVEVVLSGAEPEDGVEGEGDANGGVEAGAQPVGAGDHAEKGEDDAHGSQDSLSVAGSVLTLDHEDDAGEHESADDLVDDDLEVHGEVISKLAIWHCSDRVDGSEDWNICFLEILKGVCFGPRENTV